MEHFYEFRDWIYQIEPVEWLVFAAVIVIVNFVINFCLSGRLYVLGKGLCAKAQESDKVLGVVVSAGIWGFTVMNGPVHERSLSEFRCQNMLPWGRFRKKTSLSVRRHLELLKKTVFQTKKWDSSYEENPWWYYAFAGINWLRYLRIRKWHFPLKFLYEDGVVSHRLREGVESVAVIFNGNTLISNYKFAEEAKPLTRKQGELLMNKYIKFNNVCCVLINDIYWNDFVRLDDGTVLHRYGIMDGEANDWYIDGSDGYDVTLYAARLGKKRQFSLSGA